MTQATTYTLPNYVGPLFNITPTETTTLSLIGGINAGRAIKSTEFGFQTESLPNPEQPAHLEGQDAPAASSIARNAVTNVTQIFHYAVDISYTKQSTAQQIVGNFMGTQPVQNEFDHQVNLKLMQAARDVNYSFVRGAYNKPADNTTARKTRGLLSAMSTNVIAAAGAAISRTLLDSLFLQMYDNGAQFRNIILLAGGKQKQKISGLYSDKQPPSFNVGGVDITELNTDFGKIYIALERQMPADTVAAVEFSVLQTVFTEIVGKNNEVKGVLFYEDLAKTGASEKGQLYGEIGLDHGPENLHGKITGLSVA